MFLFVGVFMRFWEQEDFDEEGVDEEEEDW